MMNVLTARAMTSYGFQDSGSEPLPPGDPLAVPSGASSTTTLIVSCILVVLLLVSLLRMRRDGTSGSTWYTVNLVLLGLSAAWSLALLYSS